MEWKGDIKMSVNCKRNFSMLSVSHFTRFCEANIFLFYQKIMMNIFQTLINIYAKAGFKKSYDFTGKKF